MFCCFQFIISVVLFGLTRFFLSSLLIRLVRRVILYHAVWKRSLPPKKSNRLPIRMRRMRRMGGRTIPRHKESGNWRIRSKRTRAPLRTGRRSTGTRASSIAWSTARPKSVAKDRWKFRFLSSFSFVWIDLYSTRCGFLYFRVGSNISTGIEEIRRWNDRHTCRCRPECQVQINNFRFFFSFSFFWYFCRLFQLLCIINLCTMEERAVRALVRLILLVFLCNSWFWLIDWLIDRLIIVHCWLQ